MKRNLIRVAMCQLVLFTAILSIPREKEAKAGMLSERQSTTTGALAANMGPSPGTVRQNPKDGLKYVWIPAGTFMMGCSPGDNECRKAENPPHQVTITKGFWLGQTEVTVGAYSRFAGATGRQMPFRGRANENMPIVNMTWNDARGYCTWAGGRLPTEAEWEYAARGGRSEARYGNLDEIAWYANNSRREIHEVGQKRANGFGLLDMLGSVWEWVNDWYEPEYYQNSPATDPQGPTDGIGRALRGASWASSSGQARVSFRGSTAPGITIEGLYGFRCVGEVNSP
jgi:formylglycine-generating enzyme required for sulfatase activity